MVSLGESLAYMHKGGRTLGSSFKLGFCTLSGGWGGGQSLIIQSWLTWTSVGQTGFEITEIHLLLPLPRAGIKGVYHHTHPAFSLSF